MTRRGGVARASRAGASALLMDLYELTMAASYHAHGMRDDATFDLFIRELPKNRNFLVACGLEQALDFLEHLRFDEAAISYLRSLDLFKEDFLRYLASVSFTGQVRAVPEGEIVFANEPLLSVTAPLIEGQIVESYLLNCVCFQTMVASKAARVAIASGDHKFVDFSLRRDHGADAAVYAARAAYVAGAAGTSNLLAGERFGIPVSGTMAHSYILAFPSETEAFRAFARDFPGRAVLLIDTFDVEEGARRAATVASELAAEGIALSGVRIDSGDLGHATVAVRKILDEAGLSAVEIVLSGDLDEHRIDALCRAGAPVDAFGVGTQMGTSGDVPWVGGVYKLVAGASGPKMKRSVNKVTLPGAKQVHRIIDGGMAARDVLSLADEVVAGGIPLLETAMDGGRRLQERPPLDELRDRCRGSLAQLPDRLRALDQTAYPYAVEPSPGLTSLVERMNAAG